MVVPRRDDDDDVPADKAWAIHAAIIGLNTGNLLFRGLELDPDNPGMITVACLAVLAALYLSKQYSSSSTPTYKKPLTSMR